MTDLNDLAARGPFFRFEYAAFQPDITCAGRPSDDAHSRFNYKLCRALDMTSLSCVLIDMVKQGWMDKRIAELFHAQANALVAQMLSENNRCLARARSQQGENGNG